MKLTARRLCFSVVPKFRYFNLASKLIVILVSLFASTLLHSEVISGTIHDPSGAVIVGARIEIGAEGMPQPVVISSDAVGRFSSPDLKPGSYSVRVTKDGFETQIRTVELKAPVELQFTLSVAGQQVSISVSGKVSAMANSDALYTKLRNVGLGDTFAVENFTLTWDVATFQLRSGTLTLLGPVEGIATGAIFVGNGHFNLKPVLSLDANELSRRTGTAEVNEDFNAVIFRFTRDAWPKFSPGLGGHMGAPPAEAAAVLAHWKEKMRHRSDHQISLTQSIFEGETMDNVDADLLAAYYNPAHPPFFNAYIGGNKKKDLRFFVRNRVGALPQLDSPEEVALINYNPGEMDDGVWYLAHLKSEYANHTASSSEDRRLFATRRHKIETVIAKNEHLYGTATITFVALSQGERVLKFGLLPSLRVAQVHDEDGSSLYFIQESRKEDGSFYVILPAAPEVGKEHSITVEYAGDKVLEVAGEGSFYVSARSSWYPNLNGFGERALYDLTYKVPHKYKVVSVGRLDSESVEGDFAVSHWITSAPVAVAGFNYGAYTKMELPDEKTGYKISGYYLTTLPDNLAGIPVLRSMAPGAMTRYALEQTRAQLQLCTFFFGRSPYNEISITEQPNFNFGQSWPNLVYLPISAYIDSTQRWMLFGHIDNRFTGFVQEVTPHEVAHQWWGHAVGWASYHDQWLSEGFAEFSAALFLQQAGGKDWRKDYIDFWERLRQRILEKNNWGVAPDEAGPLWMGLRLISPRSQNAYQQVTYAKGAYVLAMLRSMMYSPDGQDKTFIAMMHDFVDSHQDRPASTESFKVVAEKYMPKSMDLQRNGRLDWFFDEWVYGTDVPRYHFEYQVTPADGGKSKLHMTITQSEVGDHFAMIVPIFGDFGNGMVRLAQIGMIGDSTRSADMLLPVQPRKVALNAYKEILER
jgi:Peptidase family M1 domain/Carboxypeptidase regulatory-like domain